jgi:hypothetical protein
MSGQVSAYVQGGKNLPGCGWVNMYRISREYNNDKYSITKRQLNHNKVIFCAEPLHCQHCIQLSHYSSY